MAEKPNENQRSKMYLKTMDLLKNRPVTKPLYVIAAGANVPEGWLRSILNNPSLSPSVDRIERLYEYLSHKDLQF